MLDPQRAAGHWRSPIGKAKESHESLSRIRFTKGSEEARATKASGRVLINNLIKTMVVQTRQVCTMDLEE